MFTAQLDLVLIERKNNNNNKKILLVKSFASEDKETQIAVTGVLQFFLFIGSALTMTLTPPRKRTLLTGLHRRSLIQQILSLLGPRSY